MRTLRQIILRTTITPIIDSIKRLWIQTAVGSLMFGGVALMIQYTQFVMRYRIATIVVLLALLVVLFGLSLVRSRKANSSEKKDSE